MSDQLIWKVLTLRDTGQVYTSGPFLTHAAAEDFAIAQGGSPDVLSVVIALWEQDKPTFDAETFKAMFKDFNHG